MRRILIMIMVLMMLVPVGHTKAASLPAYSQNVELGRVIEIIDGEVLKVFFYRRSYLMPQVEVVRLAGLDTDASVEAFNYASSRLLGKTLYFLFDDHVPYMDGFRSAHLFVEDDKTFAEELLDLGYASLDERFEGIRFYQEYQGAQYRAKIYELGRWATSLSETTDRININTAGVSQLKDILDIDSGHAAAITLYREHNAFNDIFEIMAADYDFDEEWFESRSHLISTITNINKASYLELTSLLPPITGRDLIVDDLIFHLKFNEVGDPDDLKEVTSFAGYLPRVRDYLTVDATNVYVEASPKKVNINTVNEEDFISVTGFSKYDYTKLTKLREDGAYVLTSLAELYKRTDLYVNASAFIYANHLTTLTNLNEAGLDELTSLFGSTELTKLQSLNYAKDLYDHQPISGYEEVRSILGDQVFSMIEPYVYLYPSDVAPRFNINTAEAVDMPKLKSDYDGLYTEITNINTASRQMLLDLNSGMTQGLVDDIVAYRTRHPFRDNEDLYGLFKAHSRLALYNEIAFYLAYE